MGSPEGRVTLVGAGPGAVDWPTRARAGRAICQRTFEKLNHASTPLKIKHANISARVMNKMLFDEL
jgi:hypothetical protein